MPELNLSKEINTAIKAALSSGKYLKKNKSELNKTSSSDPRDIKLHADVASENLIKKIINESSNYEILAEESGESSENLGRTFWVVDPLDGTANYNRDIPICCVSIGMIKDMKPLFGVIYDFNSDEIYCGDCINKVATLNNSPIQVSKIDDKKDGVLITGLPFNTDYSDSSLNNLISDMQSWKKTRMIGSAAMASCYIASGKAELYKEKGIYLWDILAGAAIVEAAGGLAEIKNVRDNYQVDVTFSNQKIKG
jgi:myo-inositol-1(or 4)-monophosphatase